MCMLFVKPSNFTLPKPYFDSLKDHNGDGVSCYDLETGELFQTLNYDKAHQYLVDNHKSNLIVHFRYGTSGEKSLSQLHGWKILNGRYSFFHNGMLSTFKGDKEKGLSDTQEFVQMVNTWEGVNIEDVVLYLEEFEKGSRFLIVDNETKKIITPNCAIWQRKINIEGTDIRFSNNYAIDWHLLQDNGHLKTKFNPDQYDLLTGYCDEEDLTDAENDMLAELSFIVQGSSLKDLIDFVTVNPEIAALYLKRDY